MKASYITTDFLLSALNSSLLKYEADVLSLIASQARNKTTTTATNQPEERADEEEENEQEEKEEEEEIDSDDDAGSDALNPVVDEIAKQMAPATDADTNDATIAASTPLLDPFSSSHTNPHYAFVRGQQGQGQGQGQVGINSGAAASGGGGGRRKKGAPNQQRRGGQV